MSLPVVLQSGLPQCIGDSVQKVPTDNAQYGGRKDELALSSGLWDETRICSGLPA
jgi:hypothetical protein